MFLIRTHIIENSWLHKTFSQRKKNQRAPARMGIRFKGKKKICKFQLVNYGPDSRLLLKHTKHFTKKTYYNIFFKRLSLGQIVKIEKYCYRFRRRRGGSCLSIVSNRSLL